MFPLKSIVCCFHVYLCVYMCRCEYFAFCHDSWLFYWKLYHDVSSNGVWDSLLLWSFMLVWLGVKLFTVCWTCRCQRLQFPLRSFFVFLLSSVFRRSSFFVKQSVNLETLFSCVPLLLYRSPVDVLLRYKAKEIIQ